MELRLVQRVDQQLTVGMSVKLWPSLFKRAFFFLSISWALLESQNTAFCAINKDFSVDEACQITVLDADSFQAIPLVKIVTKAGILEAISPEVFKVDCAYQDSVYILAPGYQDSLMLFSPKPDTILLKKNEFTLSEVLIEGTSSGKTFILGSKNRQSDYSFGFGEFSKVGGDIATVYNNPAHKKLRVVEGRIFILLNNTLTPKDSCLDITISFYENNKNKQGKVLAENVQIQNRRKKRGWYKLIFENDFVIPKSGFIAVIEKNTHEKIELSFGANAYDSESGINTYFRKSGNEWYKVPSNSEKNYGIKFYFRVK